MLEVRGNLVCFVREKSKRNMYREVNRRKEGRERERNHTAHRDGEKVERR